ncbi:MAG: ferrous iron transport protein B [Verrucomicrobiae bacterium]|nr:ferrous iron transport protein B [Verrucomicrobiae bacterium]
MSSVIATATASAERTPTRPRPFRFALAGNPNSGKTTVFNALSGLRAHTANYPGTTVEQRLGRFHLDGEVVDVVDIPGLYDLKVSSEEERIALNVLTGANPKHPKPDAVVVVADATNLSRSLFLASQIIELKLPVIVALNMMDAAEEEGIEIDSAALQRELGCPVVPVVARTGRGVDNLRAALQRTIADSHDPHPATPAACETCGSCRFQSRYAWTDAVSSRCVRTTSPKTRLWTERLDRVFTHPVIGVLAFFGVMMGVFFLIFQIATIPMDLIDALFSGLGGWLANHMPESDLRSLVTQGIIGGVGGMLVFLPQICILFFCLSLLDDTGYLARAAFVMDRLMRRVGLSGKAFVPLLSAHACAIPAIMATRVIEDKRDRLVTILVAPLISCSARIPVYSMLAALLFSRDAWKASLVFTGAYSLGIISAILAALVFKRTIFKGETRALVLELPSYKIPSLKTAFLTMIDRASVFVRKAGTVILMISIILWALATYPKSDPPAAAVQMQQQAETLAAQGSTQQADESRASADRLISHGALANSAAGRLGHWIEPVIRPLGFDWQIGIGIVSSFAAREVIVSTLAVVYGVGEDVAKENPDSLYDSLRQATRTDGSKVFTTATCASLLVFYIFAMQCLATQVVTRRETGTWKWPIVQVVYMSLLAYTASLVVYQSLRAFGIG